MLKRLLQRFRISQERLIRNFCNHGGVIGEGCKFYSPETVQLDMGKAFLIRIGSGCKITAGVTILAHDYSVSVAQNCFGYAHCLGGSAPVTIGNNCFLGMNAMILMGTVIGNNCIVGAGAVVKGTFPDNVVIGGNPARVICTLEEYYIRRRKQALEEAVACVKQVYHNTGRLPTWRQMGNGFGWLYNERTEETISKTFPQPHRKQILATPSMFGSYKEFLNYACEKAEIPKK